MNVATQRRSDLSTIAPDRSAARMPGTGPLRRSSGPVRNQAIVGMSRIGATLHRCERPVFVLHTNHFPVAGTLDQAQTFFSPFHPQPNNTNYHLTQRKVAYVSSAPIVVRNTPRSRCSSAHHQRPSRLSTNASASLIASRAFHYKRLSDNCPVA